MLFGSSRCMRPSAVCKRYGTFSPITHISPAYNFQPELGTDYTSAEYARLQDQPEEVAIFHFSGGKKPWWYCDTPLADRVYDVRGGASAA